MLKKFLRSMFINFLLVVLLKNKRHFFSNGAEAEYPEIQFVLRNSINKWLDHLSKFCSAPQPALDIPIVLEPLKGLAPLKYEHDGDVVKLKLTLSNISLIGLSQMTVQEVSFSSKQNMDGTEKIDTPADSRKLIEEDKDGDLFIEGNDELYSIFDDPHYDYDYHETISAERKSTFHDHAPEIKEQLGKRKENSHYYEDYNNYSSRDFVDYVEEDLVSADYSNFAVDAYSDKNRINPEKDKKTTTLRDLPLNMNQLRNAGMQSTSLKPFFHNNKNTQSFHKIYSLYNFQPFKDGRNLATVDDNVQKLFLPAETLKAQKKRSVNKSKPNVAAPKLPELPTVLKGKVRVAFPELEINSFYFIRGDAGGVYPFKEEGNLVIKIPNVFLSSTFNISVFHEQDLLKNWYGMRTLPIRVSKINTRLNLGLPGIKLKPTQRPPEWFRQQVEKKMKELCHGIGRRDGAVKLLLSQWARILRRMIVKPYKMEVTTTIDLNSHT